MTTIGLYAGSFDPVTLGHYDIIKRSLKFCDELVVAIGENSSKKSFFQTSEKISLLQETIDHSLKIKVTSFQGLLVNYAKEIKANILIRGIRSVSDFEYEINIANINKSLFPNIETIFLPTTPGLDIVSSSMVKEIAKYGGNIENFVPPIVEQAVYKKFGFIKLGKIKTP